MLSSKQEAEPPRGLSAGYMASVDGGDDGSEQAGCLAPDTAGVWHVCPALEVPVRPAASWGWSSVPFKVHFPITTRNSGLLKWEAAPHPCPPRSLQKPPSVNSDIPFP